MSGNSTFGVGHHCALGGTNMGFFYPLEPEVANGSIAYHACAFSCWRVGERFSETRGNRPPAGLRKILWRGARTRLFWVGRRKNNPNPNLDMSLEPLVTFGPNDIFLLRFSGFPRGKCKTRIFRFHMDLSRVASGSSHISLNILGF